MEATENNLTCQCCGGSMPPREIWEARRDEAGKCTGAPDGDTGRCVAWADDELWTIED